ncbi:hypothetical protein [Streptomyces sp. NPDC001502]|uniref:hypothetical protein n=1 Tax=Streptomyces sp. NPDC001502 TaxID=3364578 RepID=UPI0036AC3356
MENLLTTGRMFPIVDALAGVCSSANMKLPREELLALQIAKPAEEAGEAWHALQGLLGLMPSCADDCATRDEHSWNGVSNDLVGASFASLIALNYIDAEGWQAAVIDGFRQRLAEIGSPLAEDFEGQNRILDAVEELGKHYAAAADGPGYVTPILALGNLTREAGEAIHSLHGIKGLLTCDEECGQRIHSWEGVKDRLVGSFVTSLVGLYCVDPAGWRSTFETIAFRRSRRGRELLGA